MDRLLPCCLTLLLVGTSRLSAAENAAPPREMTAAEGMQLPRLAREAMRRYLADRTPPEAMPIPADVRALAGRKNAVAVTLRSGGAVVAVGVHEGDGIARGLVTAALRAMRSPRLPDRVDRKVLDALTVEVDVFSALREVRREELPACFVPGLTGLAYWREAPGRSAPAEAGCAWVLPSAGYVLGLNAEQMRRGAMLRYRLTPANSSLPPRLAVFTTRHFVHLADGRAFELFRGKDMPRRLEAVEAAVAAAGQTVGAYLARHQGRDGRYTEEDRPAALRDHLYAAWAMARLARQVPAPELARSASAAVAHASKLLRREGGKAYVAEADDALAPTALLALALGEAGEGDRPALHGELLGWLLERLGSDGSAAATGPASVSAERYMGLLALGGAGAAGDRVARLRNAMAAGRPDDFAARAWARRAGLPVALFPDSPGGASASDAKWLGPEALPDERGGVGVDGRPPTVVRTALAAACLARDMEQATGLGASVRAARERWSAARRFCYGMMYQPGEAYFTADPNGWVGGVRAEPGCGAVTTAACAAAIDALLSR